jgi:hypothetical protein
VTLVACLKQYLTTVNSMAKNKYEKEFWGLSLLQTDSVPVRINNLPLLAFIINLGPDDFGFVSVAVIDGLVGTF